MTQRQTQRPETRPGTQHPDGRRDEAQAPQRQVVAGLIASPGLPLELAEDLAQRLQTVLARRAPAVHWTFEVRVEPLAGSASIDVDLVQLTRERMLAEGWQLAICLTDLPVRVRHRPVTAFATRALGVGVVSVPAFGAVDLEERVLQAVLNLVAELDTEDAPRVQQRLDRAKHSRLRYRRLSSAVGSRDVQGKDKVRFVAAPSVGNLRLLLGMVRANRPWRLIIGLSRVMVAALGTAAFGLSGVPFWWIADAMSWPRLFAIGLAAAAVICVTLIVGHGLWERPKAPAARERVMLVNIATVTTVALGVLTLLAALFVVMLVCTSTLLVEPVLSKQIEHPAETRDYIAIAWLVTAMGILGGAIGSALETDVSVREATYGYHATDSGGGASGPADR